MSWTLKVVDLSHWNKTVDFAALKAHGIVGAYLKASDGPKSVDPTFQSRVKLARAQGLLVGAYHFGQAGATAPQIDNFSKQLKLAGGVDELGKAFDWEKLKADKKTPAIPATAAHEFLFEAEQAFGHKIKLYSFASYLVSALGNHVDSYMAQHDLWLADYRKGSLRLPQRTWATRGVWMWQNSGSGKVPGVVGACDTDMFNGTDDQLHATWVKTL